MRRLMRLRTEELILVGILAFLILGAYGVAESDVLASGNPTDDLVVHYRFDEGAGQTAYDATDNGNDGTLSGFDFTAKSGWTDGISGNALVFNGSNDFVYDNDFGPANDPRDAITVAMWAKPENGDVSLLNRRSSNGTHFGWRHWHIDYYNSQFNLQISTWDGSSAGDVRTVSSRSQPVDEWYHLTMTYDESTGVLTGYINGKQVGTTQVPAGEREIYYDHENPVGSDDNRLFIGDFDGVESPGNATIDDIRVYSTALNQSQVKTVYNRGSSVRIGTEPNGAGGKVLDLGFRKQNSTHVFDTSGKTNHGKPQNGATQKGAVHCKIGRCYDFGAGSNDEVVNVADDMSLDGMDALTMMAWVKSTNSTDSIERIFSKWYSPQDYQLFIDEFDRGSDGQNDQVACEINTTASSILFDADTTQGTIDGDSQWHHVACRYNGSHAGIYVDGILQNRQPLTGTIGSGDDTLSIGANDGGGNDFDGLIDQAKIFDRALNRREIIEEAGIEWGGAVLDMRFDEGTGTTVHDRSIHGNDATIWPNESEAFHWVDGVSGTAVKGSNDYQGEVQINSPETLELENNFAISLWFTPGNWSGDAYQGTLVRKRGSGSGRPYWLYGARPGEELYFEMRPDNGNYHALFTDKTDWKPSRWYHLVAQYYNNQTWEIWVNGKKDTSKTESIPVSTATGDFDMAYDGFNGSIDDVKVFPYKLSADKIRRLYRRGNVRFGEQGNNRQAPQERGANKLVGRWSFDHRNSTHALDNSGNVNHGKLVNGPSERGATHCQVGRCYRFNGANDERIQVPHDSDIRVTNSLTVAAWVNADVSQEYDYPRIVRKGESRPYQILIKKGDNDPVPALDINASTYESHTVKGTTNITEGGWHHVAGTWNGTHMRMYVDGVSEGKTAFSGDLVTSNGDLWIGSGYFWSFLNGSLDDVRLYNRSLSDQEIWELYSTGRDRSGSGEMAGPMARWRFDQVSGTVAHDSVDRNDGALNFYADDWEVYENGSKPSGWYISTYGGCDGNCTFDFFTTTENAVKGDTAFRYRLNPKGGPGSWETPPAVRKDLEHPIPLSENMRIHWKQYDREHALHVCLKVENNASQIRNLCYLANADNHWGNLCSGDEDVNMSDASGKMTHDCTDCYDAWYEYERKIYADYEDTYCDSTKPVNITALEFKHFLDESLSGDRGSDIDDFWINDKESDLRGKRGRALEFDGTDDYVAVPATHITPRDEITVTSWVNINTKTSDSSDQAIVSKDYDYLLNIFGTNRAYPGHVEGGGTDTNGNGHWCSAGPPVDDGSWHFIAYTYDGRYIRVYIDGELKRRCDEGSFTFRDVADTTTIGAVNTNAFRPVNGTIDDVRIYPYALSQDQLNKVMRQGSVSIG